MQHFEVLAWVAAPVMARKQEPRREVVVLASNSPRRLADLSFLLSLIPPERRVDADLEKLGIQEFRRTMERIGNYLSRAMNEQGDHARLRVSAGRPPRITLQRFRTEGASSGRLGERLSQGESEKTD